MLAMKPCCANAPGLAAVLLVSVTFITPLLCITRVACLRIDRWTTAPLSDRVAADEGGERAAGRVILDADS